MARLSNAQGLLFVEIFQEEIAAEGPAVTTLKDWFGHQQVGQAKAMISDAVSANRGVVTHTVGDATLSSFPDARNAVAAAIAIRNKLFRTRKASSTAIVRMRAGIAYGAVRVIAGKVSGDAVTAAGLLMEKAGPDEVLADQALADAAARTEGITFEARGAIDGIQMHLVVGGDAVPVSAPTIPGALPATPAALARAAAPPPPAAPAARAAPVAPVAPVAPAAPAAKVTKAVVITLGGAELRFDPAVGAVSIGRGPENHINVPLRHVSRKHARIFWPGGGMPFIANLSPNGTCMRPAGSNTETSFTDQVPLLGSGDLALCGSFGQVSTPDEIIRFTLVDP